MTSECSHLSDLTASTPVQPEIPEPAPYVGVLVPAHDEESTVVRGVGRLLDGLPPSSKVVVVVNGSTDRTEERVAQMREASAVARETVQLEVLEQAGKPGALRRGAAILAGSPLVIVDADVELTGEAVGMLASALQGSGPPRAAVTRIVVSDERSSRAVQRWVSVWRRSVYATDHVIGSGVVAVNAAGAEILAGMPDVLNDDAWVRMQFPEGRRVFVDVPFVVHAPRTLVALVSRRARVVNGNRELRRTGATDPASTRAVDVRRLVRDGDVNPTDAAVFILVTVLARSLAGLRRATGRSRVWASDRTSRTEGAQ